MISRFSCAIFYRNYLRTLPETKRQFKQLGQAGPCRPGGPVKLAHTMASLPAAAASLPCRGCAVGRRAPPSKAAL